MLHGYEYVKRENGELVAIDKETGEVFPTRSIAVPLGSITYSPKDIKAYTERKEREQQEYYKSKRSGKKKPPYTFVSTAADLTEISPANITRLIYLSTYLSYHDNELRLSERHKIRKCELSDILKISSATVDRFWNEVSPKYVYEDNNGTLKLNPDIFTRGNLRRLISFYIKVFAAGMRNLYKSVPINKHKQLGYIFAMLPYVNSEHNILCFNTRETDINKIEPMSMEDFCAEIGFDYRHVNRLHDAFKQIKFDVGEGKQELFCSIIKNEYTGKELMIVNPKVFYSGKNAGAVMEFGVFYSSKNSNAVIE